MSHGEFGSLEEARTSRVGCLTLALAVPKNHGINQPPVLAGGKSWASDRQELFGGFWLLVSRHPFFPGDK